MILSNVSDQPGQRKTRNFASLRFSGSRARDASENPVRSGIVQRRPLGVRLRLVDVAARLRLHRAGPGAAVRRAPPAMRLFLRPSRGARKAQPSAPARPPPPLPPPPTP